MAKWLVITPEYPYIEALDFYGGPTYDVRDSLEIEADNSRDALRLAAKAMMADHRSYSYCRERRGEGLCPFTGLTVEEVPSG